MSNYTPTELKALIPDRPTPWDYTNKVWEVPGSRQLRVNTSGVTGSVTYRGFQYSWVENGVPTGESTTTPIIGSILPNHGTQWSDIYFYCRLQDIEFKELENGMAEATCNYTSDGFVSNLQTSISNNQDRHSVPNQAKWAVNTPSAATSVDNPYIDVWEVPDRYMEYKVTYTTNYTESQGYTVQNYVNFCKGISMGYNSINSTIWHSFPAQSMLCVGLDCEPTYTFNGFLISIKVNATFKIFADYHSHLLEWMPPVPLPDSQGNDMIWHNIPNQPYPYNMFYTTDQYKLGTKVFINDITISQDAQGQIIVTPISPTPNHGGWYKPYMEVYSTGTPIGYIQYYKHDLVDFTATLGIPRFTTDPTPTP